MGQKESYAYDMAGRMIRRTDLDGNDTCYAYTPEGKLAGITYADGRKAEWRYDEKGNCTQMQDWRGVTRMEYDVMGRVIKVTDPDGRETVYGKGALGECSRLRYSNDREVVYRYNEMGRLTELILGEDSVCYHYDEAGRLAEKCLPNGICTSYQYDSCGNMIQIRHEGKEFVEEYRYRFDACGNKVQMKKTWKGETEGSETYDYSYDAMNRLTEVRKDQEPIRSYAYDAFGNRIRKTVCQNGDRQEIVYAYNENNQLIREEEIGREASYQYDRAGNLTEVIENGIVIEKYDYDTAGRMCSAWRQEDGQFQKIVYLYNGWNQRVRQKIYRGSAPEELSLEKEIRYDTDPARSYRNLMQAADETHGQDQTYIWDGGIAALSEGDRIGYYLSDDLGSVRFLTDEKGNIRERYEYDEFGIPVREDRGQQERMDKDASHMKQPFRYTGYQMDETIGLYYAHERSYDAVHGRFTGEDVLRGNMREPYTQNHYVYCWNRPLQYVDPDGREPKAVAEAGINGGLSILADGTVADITEILRQPKTVSPGIGNEIKGAPVNMGLYQHQTEDCSRETAVPELPGFRDLLIHAGAAAGGSWDADPKSWSWFEQLVEMAGRNQDGAVTTNEECNNLTKSILGVVTGVIDEMNNQLKGTKEGHNVFNTAFEFQYNWAKEGLPSTKFVTPEFMEKVIEISRKLQINPDDLMSVMAFESGFDPAIKNPGSSATGLIQFVSERAVSLGTTVEELSNMSGVEQLDYVYKHYESYAGKLKDVGDVYMVTLWPSAVGKPDSYALFVKGDKYYDVNSGLDYDCDGIVTKEEATRRVIEKRDIYKFESKDGEM